jgi:hypothetical protein
MNGLEKIVRIESRVGSINIIVMTNLLGTMLPVISVVTMIPLKQTTWHGNSS